MRNLQEGVGVGLGKLTKYLKGTYERGFGNCWCLASRVLGNAILDGFDDKFADISLDLPLPYSTDDYSQLWQWLSSLGLISNNGVYSSK